MKRAQNNYKQSRPPEAIAMEACCELLSACRSIGNLAADRLGLEKARKLAEEAVKKWSPEVCAEPEDKP